MDDLQRTLPDGSSTTPTRSTRRVPVSEGIKEILKTLGEAMVLVILVVFLFLQNWRATLIPMLAVPVSLIGTFAALPAARLLGQHAVAVRPRARHRPRRRRRDRRRGGGRASHRGGHEPEGRDAAGDGGSLRPGRRHRADPGGGVHPGRVDGRHPGAAEPAVRDHDRRVGADLGLQRADAVAGAVGDAAAAAEGVEGLASRASSARSTAGSRGRRAATSA